MKTKKITILSGAVAALLAGMTAHAQFNYNTGDLLLGFRNGLGAGTGNDLVVDIGSASLYKAAVGPITVSGTYYTSQQLTDAGLSLNGVYLSIFGDSVNDDLFVTGTSGTPWMAENFNAQAPTAGRIESIASGALDASLANSGADWTASASVVSNSYSAFAGSDLSYTIGVGPNGNFANTFLGNIELTTDPAFTSGSTSAILDLYELDVAHAGSPGQLLGDFQLDPNGTLTFNPVPEPATWAMLGVGTLLLVSAYRFRRKDLMS